MKNLKRTLLLLLLCGCGTITGVFAQHAKYVVLISIDGFRPDFYRNSSWPAANLQQMAAEGVSADGVTGIFPTVTYPSHTTLITGVPSALHGIYYNTIFDCHDDRAVWHSKFSDVHAETLWQAARKAGLTTASVSWPITVGAPIDYNIPEIWSETNPLDRRGATAEYSTPKGLFEEAVAGSTGHLEMSDYNLTSLSMDENLSRLAGYILRKYHPRLLTIHLPCVDGAEHASGREGFAVRRAVAGADHAVSNIMDALTKASMMDSTAVIVTGDHGFVNTQSALAPNVWLVKAGLLSASGRGSEWKASFISTGGSVFLHLKDPKDKKTFTRVRQILDSLPESRRRMFRIVEGAELKASLADPNVALALTAVQGIAFSNALEGPDLSTTQGGTHGYFPDFPEIRTGFIGYGVGFRKGAVIPVMNLVDVAPTVAALLGISLPEAIGTSYPGMFQSAH